MAFKRKAYYVLIGFFLCLNSSLRAQDQKAADSLYKVYLADTLRGTERFELLNSLAFNEGNDLDLALKITEELITLASKDGDHLYMYHGLLQKGSVLNAQGEFNSALDVLFKSIDEAIKANYLEGEAVAYSVIADAYSEIGNEDNAERYYDKGIAILRKTNDSISLASALLNAGDELFNNKKYDRALQNYEEAGLIFNAHDYLIGKAYYMGNIGMVYAEQGKNDLAKSNINNAISILEDLQGYYAISEYLTYMSDIYLEQNDWKTALSYAERSLMLANKYGLKKQMSESNLKLSELFESVGNQAKSFKYYKDHIVYRDSLTDLEKVEEMANLRTDFEVSQKQKEVEILELKEKRQKSIMYGSIAAFLVLCLFVFGMYRRYQYVKATKSIIEYEKNRSENLLLNILPLETAQELKQNGKVQAKRFESVSVLFTDFKGFTNFAENLSPEKLVESIDFYFSKFDEIMENYNLEKIKTVGDAYMCAGGLHHPKDDHAKRMVMAAYDILDFVSDYKERKTPNEVHFDVRIGINTGAVVAGVVGSKKFAYDIWGDSVNVASRMESNSESGKLNISEHTYELVKDVFECEYRGEIDIKNHGAVKMYFVTSVDKKIRAEYRNENKLVVV